MKSSLVPGVHAETSVTVVDELTVPAMAPWYPNFTDMPRVFATAFMVGFLESAAMKAIEAHLDEGEGSVGIQVDVTHEAPSVVGSTIQARAEVTAVEGRVISFEVELADEAGIICTGSHQRAVINMAKFPARAQQRFEDATGGAA